MRRSSRRPSSAPAPSLLSLPDDLLRRVLGLDNPRNCMAAAQLNQRLRRLGQEAAVQRAADPKVLRAAVRANNRAMVRALLAAGGDLRAFTSSDMWPLHHAAEVGDLDMIQLLLRAMRNPPVMVSTPPADGFGERHTPLMLAARHGRNEVVRMLLREGASINSCDEDCPTALCEAVIAGHEATWQLLLEEGANVNRDHPTTYPALSYAADCGNLEAAEQLLDAGAQVDGRGGGGNFATPLYLAAERGHLEVAQLLLARGANTELTGAKVNQFEEDGDTPLYAAAANGDVEVARLLLEEGSALVNAVNDKNSTAMHAAAAGGHVAVMELLLSRSARVDVAEAPTNATSLLNAAERGNVEAVELLLEQGSVDVDAALQGNAWWGVPGDWGEGLDNKDGWTALHLAAKSDCVGVTRALLAASADRTLLSAAGETALEVAERCGSTAVASLLRAG